MRRTARTDRADDTRCEERHEPQQCRKCGGPADGDTLDAGASSLLRQPKAVWATAGRIRRRLHGHRPRRPDPAVHRQGPGGHAQPGLPALHLVLPDHRRRDAASPASSPAGSAARRRCSPGSRSSWSSPRSPAPRAPSASSSASGPAGAWATRSSSRRRSPSSSAPRRAAARRAILLYESALGLGMACGPLVGALLGDASWRYPFFGTAALMAIGFLCITAFLKEQPRPASKTSLLDPVKALGHGGLASAAASAFFYNYTFFTVLAFTPFVLNMTPYKSGAVFFAWGVLLAVFSVLVAPRHAGPLRLAEGARRLAGAARRRPAGPRATAATPPPSSARSSPAPSSA